MKKLLNAALVVVTSIGGFLEAGSLGTSLQAGALFRYRLLWALALGTICIAFLTEMTGRLAAVSRHSMIDAMRERFGFSFQVWPLAAQLVVDLLVLASEIGGAALALELATGVSLRWWAAPIVFVVWIVLWLGTFGAIEHSVALLGMVTLVFVWAAHALVPDWAAAAHGLIPSRPDQDAGEYAYLAVGIIGATVSPYLVTFYSSGAIEEEWKEDDVIPNRFVAGLGMSFGSLVSAAVMIVGALVLAPHGIRADTYHQGAVSLVPVLGRWGFRLFVASLFVGCVGAAFELALDIGYIASQTFGWTWGEAQKPRDAMRFALTYTMALALAAVPSLFGLDPLRLTMFSMAVTVLAMPIVIGPLIVIMNDKQYLKAHTNGTISNVAVVGVIAIAFVLAVLAIPVQLAGS